LEQIGNMGVDHITILKIGLIGRLIG